MDGISLNIDVNNIINQANYKRVDKVKAEVLSIKQTLEQFFNAPTFIDNFINNDKTSVTIRFSSEDAKKLIFQLADKINLAYSPIDTSFTVYKFYIDKNRNTQKDSELLSKIQELYKTLGLDSNNNNTNIGGTTTTLPNPNVIVTPPSTPITPGATNPALNNGMIPSAIWVDDLINSNSVLPVQTGTGVPTAKFKITMPLNATPYIIQVDTRIIGISTLDIRLNEVLVPHKLDVYPDGDTSLVFRNNNRDAVSVSLTPFSVDTAPLLLISEQENKSMLTLDNGKGVAFKLLPSHLI